MMTPSIAQFLRSLPHIHIFWLIDSHPSNVERWLEIFLANHGNISSFLAYVMLGTGFLVLFFAALAQPVEELGWIMLE